MMLRIYRETFPRGPGKRRGLLKKWYINYTDHNGKLRKRAGHESKSKTMRLAADIRDGVDIAKKAARDEKLNAHRPDINIHLDDWKQSILDNGSSTRMRKIFDHAQVFAWKDIKANRIQRACKQLTKCVSTYNQYLKSCKQFCKWMVYERRARYTPLDHLRYQTLTPDLEIRGRTHFTGEQLKRLINTAMISGENFGIRGRERALVYTLAVETGLRANEIKTLEVRDLDFENQTVTVRASNAKSRRSAILPLRDDLNETLRGWVGRKDLCSTVFEMPQGTDISKMIYADMEEARIPKINLDGRRRDFHSLRHTFITNLAQAGVHPRVAQELARHSDIKLTLARYTHVHRNDLSDAVSRLPKL